MKITEEKINEPVYSLSDVVMFLGWVSTQRQSTVGKYGKDYADECAKRKEPLVDPRELDPKFDLDPRFDPSSPLFDEDAYEQAVIDWYKSDGGDEHG